MVKIEYIHGLWVMLTIMLLEVFEVGVVDVAFQAPVHCAVVIGIQDIPKAELNVGVHSLVVRANTPGRFIIKVTVFTIVKPSRVTEICIFAIVFRPIDSGLSVQQGCVGHLVIFHAC